MANQDISVEVKVEQYNIEVAVDPLPPVVTVEVPGLQGPPGPPGDSEGSTGSINWQSTQW